MLRSTAGAGCGRGGPWASLKSFRPVKRASQTLHCPYSRLRRLSRPTQAGKHTRFWEIGRSEAKAQAAHRPATRDTKMCMHRHTRPRRRRAMTQQPSRPPSPLLHPCAGEGGVGVCSGGRRGAAAMCGAGAGVGRAAVVPPPQPPPPPPPRCHRCASPPPPRRRRLPASSRRS